MHRDEYTGLEKAVEEQCKINIFCDDKELRHVEMINESKSPTMRLQGYGEGETLYEAIWKATENYLNGTTFDQPYRGRPLTGREKLTEIYLVKYGARIVLENDPNRRVVARISSPVNGEYQTDGKFSAKVALDQLEKDLVLMNEQMISMNLNNDVREKGRGK